MENEKKKRNRGPNFSNDEKVLLLNIIENYKHILECKKTDGATWRDKESAWERVVHEFNASSPSSTKRSLDSVKICYENIKRNTRKKASVSKIEITKTGGGSASSSTCADPIFDLTLSILNKKTIFGIKNKFDGDQQQNSIDGNHNNDNDINNVEFEQNFGNVDEVSFPLGKEQAQHLGRQELEEEIVEHGENIDWGNFKPQFLQTPVNKKLQNVRDSSTENISASSSNNTVNNNIQSSKWTKRRRPTINSAANVARQYEDVAAIKLQVFSQQLRLMKREEEYKEKQWKHEELIRETEKKRAEEKWELEKQNLLLDIRLKETQLDKLNRM